MSLVTASSLSLAHGKKVILHDAGFAVGLGERIGLVGANGTGKSTLLRVLAGQQSLDSGEVRFMRGVRVGYLPQDILSLPQGRLVDAVLASIPGREELEREVTSTEAGLRSAADEAQSLELSQRLADLHAKLADFEGRYGRHQAERILGGLGFSGADLEKDTSTLSGGWKMRAALAGLLLQAPDLLLLDEPTNHLDIPSVEWFDGFLRRSTQALVLVCHDREFLNRQISRVLSFEMEGLRSYTGSYEDYRRQREEEEEQLQAQAKRQAQARAATEEFIERFRYKATKARQVQSRIKQLEKQEKVEVREQRATVHFRFPEVARSGREVLRLTGVAKSFGDRVVYRAVDQTVQRGERIAIVGVNGAGKTTLLKIVAGELAADAGEVALGHNVQLAYYAQHHTDLLERRSTVLEQVAQLVPEQPQSYVRGVLGAFLFSGDDVEKPIGVLSGGERARVALARLLVLPSNLILMDEPTNHLDLQSAEKLVEALKGYGGTLIFVSHNRSFVNQLATRVWDVRDGGIYDHSGNLDDYLYHRAQLQEAEAPATLEREAAGGANPVDPKERRRREALAREERTRVLGPVKKELAATESRIAELEAAQKELEPQLADPGIYNDFARARPLLDAFQANKAELEELYQRWEAQQQKLAELERVEPHPEVA